MYKYKVSTLTEFMGPKFGHKTAIKLIKEAGFDYYDFSMFDIVGIKEGKLCPSNNPIYDDEHYLDYVKDLKNYADSIGITCNQAHAPFPSCIEGINKYLIRSLEVASILGAKNCVIHPMNNGTIEENTEFYNELLPYAEKYNINICTENMFNWNFEKQCTDSAACSDPTRFTGLLNSVNNERLVACLDIGHSELTSLGTSAYEMIVAIGPKLKALHIHDNDKVHDLHQIPFGYSINYNEVARGLKEANYQGDLTLEADNYFVGKKVETIEEAKLCLHDLFEAVQKLNKLASE